LRKLRAGASGVVRDETQAVPVTPQLFHRLRAAGDGLARDVEDPVEVEENGGHRRRLYPRHALGRDSARRDRAAFLALERARRTACAEDRNAGRSTLRHRGFVGPVTGAKAAGPEQGRARHQSGGTGRAKSGEKPWAGGRAADRAAPGGTAGAAKARPDRAEREGERATARGQA